MCVCVCVCVCVYMALKATQCYSCTDAFLAFRTGDAGMSTRVAVGQHASVRASVRKCVPAWLSACVPLHHTGRQGCAPSLPSASVLPEPSVQQRRLSGVVCSACGQIAIQSRLLGLTIAAFRLKAHQPQCTPNESATTAAMEPAT